MTTDELKQELTSIKKSDLLYLIEGLMADGVIDITDITLCHTRSLESKLAAIKIFEADKCIFESVFTDSIGKPADNAALMRKLEWMKKTGMHNMAEIMEYLKNPKTKEKESKTTRKEEGLEVVLNGLIKP